MKLIFLSIFLLSTLFASSQNVGIGTITPGYKLHILGPDAASSNTNVIVESPTTTAFAGLKLNSGGVLADFTLFGPAAGGSLFGVPVANLARIYNTGPVLIGASGSSKLYLGTNNNVRMTFDENGLGGINSNPFTNTQLNLNTFLRDGLYVTNNTAAPGIAFGVNSQIVSTVGSAIGGTASVNGESVSAFEAGGYGVLATAGNTGIGGGFFTLAGTAVRAKSLSGLALSTTGSLRFTNIGEGANKVLTSDASGNATWQTFAGGAGPWTVSGNDIYNSNTGNVGIGVNANNFSRLHVRRFDNATYAPGAFRGSIFAENGSTNEGSGVYGVTGAPRTGAEGFAGVTGLNVSTTTDMFGVVGESSGSSTPGFPSAGVGGYGSYGVLGYSGDASGAGVMAQSGASGGNALELNNGYIKVSGTNKAVFVHTAVVGNISGNTTTLTYANPAATDMLIVTPNWNPGGAGGTYNVNPIGVFWTGTTWAIFNENSVSMPVNSAYNVMVVKN